jgi:O-antigen biosynthesis protein
VTRSPHARAAPPAAPQVLGGAGRAPPRAAGKFLFEQEHKLQLKGVTYGTFRPDADGSGYPDPPTLEDDFRMMAASGFNAVRTYTVPPARVLDAAQRHGLWVMVGLAWEQHVAFLDSRSRRASIESRVRRGVAACAGHPALLCCAIGNEIPAPIVRWHGRRRVERFLERLCQAAKQEHPDGLVTYVNFPSTEYLELPFLDIVTFNIYLESQRALAAYLARLQNLAGDRPLLMAEIGLDSRRNGEAKQSQSLSRQVDTAITSGCAGAFVFSWTDEWHRGGYEIEDWDFGLTTRDRAPKPALGAVSRAFDRKPVHGQERLPRVSVVVCSCNGARTLRDTLEGLAELDYPDYEVIVVNDGSTDHTEAIVGDFPGFRLISTPNNGLSGARNTGLRAATGEIVAYVDDDARPDPSWLTYLVHTFETTDHAGVGGPNIAPAGDGAIADCVANAPGGPIHVLLSDREAEHIPGCNMAFRREHLEAVGGFDPQFRTAGDDVDLCWRLQQRGWTLGFHPAALVWHHRRNSLRAYWRQQRGYGKAEALLERKWPEKYNSAGHLTWRGRLYGSGLLHSALPRRWRIYYGTWGTGLFQSLYKPSGGIADSIALMPEWYLFLAVLSGLAALGLHWRPLLLALPLLGLGIGALVVQALRGAWRARFTTKTGHRQTRLGRRALTAALYLVQPLARLHGRISTGLTPWRRRGGGGPRMLRGRTLTDWSESWRPHEDWLGTVEAALFASGASFRRGGDFDRWDLHVRGGPLGAARIRMAVEEHGAGRQLARCKVWPRCSLPAAFLLAGVAALAAAAALDGAPVAAGALGAFFAALALRLGAECGTASAVAVRAVRSPRGEERAQAAEPGHRVHLLKVTR